MFLARGCKLYLSGGGGGGGHIPSASPLTWKNAHVARRRGRSKVSWRGYCAHIGIRSSYIRLCNKSVPK